MKTCLENIIVKNEYGTFPIKIIIQEFKQQVYGVIDDDIIISMKLFGSYAKGLQTSESDIDICIVYDDCKISELDINLCVDKISFNLFELYGVNIHALCFRNSYFVKYKNDSLLFKDIEKEGLSC